MNANQMGLLRCCAGSGLCRGWRRRLTGSALLGLVSPGFAAGLLTPTSGGLPELQIKSHHVDVVVEDGYVITRVEQVFFNPHSEPLEAIYRFPVPENAAVAEFTYWIDGQPVTGEVVEKARAREIYREEKEQGNAVALTEQDGYRTFDSRVYPVQPQSEVKIRLRYLQTVQVDMGVGRYVYPLEEGGVDEQQLGFWTTNQTVTESFRFNLQLRSSYPIAEFRLPQQPQAAVTRISANEWQVGFGKASADPAEEATTVGQMLPAQSLNRDIVVYWRHEEGLPGGIDMVTYRAPGSDQGTFMLTVTPGEDLPLARQGRDWVFVLDISGSMQGKYATLVEGVSQSLRKLHPNDRFRIVLFNDRARELTRGYVPVSRENIDRYSEALQHTAPGGGTNLYDGVQLGFRSLDGDRPSAVLLVTDGVANVGQTEKKAFLALLQKADVRLFSFLMGNSANKPLLEGMATVSNGFAMAISNSDDIVGRILQTQAKMTHEAYRDLDLDISGRGVSLSDITPQQIGSLYRGQQLTVFGHYRGDGPATLKLTAKVGAERRTYTSALAFPSSNTLNPELERLWAFASIDALQAHMAYLGEDSDSRQAIVDLAVEYGLVTDYTSMVVLADEQFQRYGIDRHNRQRVATEQRAGQARTQQGLTDHRQDTRQPTFSQVRPGVGGGALGPWVLLVLLPLLFMRRRERAHD